ncbi:hypothetical protein ABBQ38_008580 [Trebouxia sp. C0009 RCD-2024]
MPRESTFCDHKRLFAAAQGLTGATTAGLELANCVADSPKNRSGSYYSTEIGKAWPLRAKPSGSLSQKVEGDTCYPTALLLHAQQERFAGLTCVLLDQQKWTDDHPEQPEGYLVFPSSKVSAFLSHTLADCTASSSKDPHGAVKSARKALRHLRACQVGIPEEGTEFPSQPYIAGVTN